MRESHNLKLASLCTGIRCLMGFGGLDSARDGVILPGMPKFDIVHPLFFAHELKNGDVEYINVDAIETVVIPGNGTAPCQITMKRGRVIAVQDERDELLDLMNCLRPTGERH